MSGLYAGVWLHGEAVAAGIVIAADLSYRLGWIDKALFERTQRLIEQAELPVAPPKVAPASPTPPFTPQQHLTHQ